MKNLFMDSGITAAEGKDLFDDCGGGVFLVDKPAGISSFKAVTRLKKIFNIKKVGHSGTLDPFATGLLIICVGRAATKLISGLMDGEKEYFATLKLGEQTETIDPEGKVICRSAVGKLSAEQIEICLQGFRGEQMQTPPVYSALKHKGKPLYYYARKGIEIKKDPRKIIIKELERVDGQGDLNGDTAEMQIRVLCSRGTYIRTLGADIGNSLGCGAHLVALRRTKSGCFSVDQALNWDELNSEKALENCLKKIISVRQVANLTGPDIS